MRFFRSLFCMVCVALLVLAVSPMVFGAETAAVPSVDWLLAILKGGALGVGVTLLGWLKNAEIDKFDWRGLIVKVPVGFVVGLIAAYKGIPFEDATTYAVGLGLVSIIDQAVKLLARRAKDAWGWEILSQE